MGREAYRVRDAFKFGDMGNVQNKKPAGKAKVLPTLPGAHSIAYSYTPPYQQPYPYQQYQYQNPTPPPYANTYAPPQQQQPYAGYPPPPQHQPYGGYSPPQHHYHPQYQQAPAYGGYHPQYQQAPAYGGYPPPQQQAPAPYGYPPPPQPHQGYGYHGGYQAGVLQGCLPAPPNQEQGGGNWPSPGGGAAAQSGASTAGKVDGGGVTEATACATATAA